MLKRILLVVTVVLVCSLAALGAYATFAHKGHVEAARLSNCIVKSSTKSPTTPRMTITCTGQMVVATPFGKRTEPFTLVVDAIDNPPAGPSFGDQIIGCTLSVDNTVPRAIHAGPCP